MLPHAITLLRGLPLKIRQNANPQNRVDKRALTIPEKRGELWTIISPFPALKAPITDCPQRSVSTGAGSISA